MHSRARIAVLSTLAVVGTGLGIQAASAGSATVKVSALSRSGQPMAIDATLVNLATGKVYQVNSSGLSVPTGKYAVGAYINEFPVFTVGVRTISVSKNVSVLFDAGKATKVGADVDDGSVSPTALAVVPFAELAGGKEKQLLNDNGVTLPPQSTYVIPAPGSSAIRMAVHAALTPDKDAPGAVRYDLVKSFRGVPADLSLQDKKAKMARVDLNVSTIDHDQTTFLRLVPRNPNGKPVVSADVGAPVLGKQVSYRTAGLTWAATLSMSAPTSGFVSLTTDGKKHQRVYAAGATQRETWGAGVWGPRPASPAVYTNGGQLRVAGGPPICAWSGPGVTLSDCQLQPQQVTYTIKKGASKLGSGPSVAVGVGAPAWYDVIMAATRGNGDLCTAVNATWHVKAGGPGQVETGYLHLSPGGLDDRNRAKGGSTTPISIETVGLKAVKTVTLAYSTDGKAWHTVKLVRKAGRWVGKIHNPGNGAVSLRSSATGASGASISETVTDAYGVR
jgi:hypothetical protein